MQLLYLEMSRLFCAYTSCSILYILLLLIEHKTGTYFCGLLDNTSTYSKWAVPDSPIINLMQPSKPTAVYKLSTCLMWMASDDGSQLLHT